MAENLLNKLLTRLRESNQSTRKLQAGGEFKEPILPIPEWARNHSDIAPYGYKIYEGDDLSDVETFNKNWHKYRDEQLYNEFYKYKGIDGRLQNEIDFPLFGGKRLVDKTTFVEGVKKHINKRLDTAYEWTISDALKDPEMWNKLIQSLPKYSAGKPDSFGKRKIESISGKKIGGFYYPKGHLILYSDGFENSSSKIHEREHAIIWPMHLPLPKLQSRRPVEIRKQLLPGIAPDSYYDNPYEIRSRLMELRYMNHLDPTHKYDLQEIRNMRGDKTFKDFNIFKRYDDNTIEYLLNNVASNYESKNNTSTQKNFIG